MITRTLRLPSLRTGFVCGMLLTLTAYVLAVSAQARGTLLINEDSAVVDISDYLIPVIDKRKEQLIADQQAAGEVGDASGAGEAIVPSEKPDETPTISEDVFSGLGLELWYQFDIGSASGEPLERLLVVHQPVPQGLGFLNTARDPLIIKRIVTTDIASGPAEEIKALLRSDQAFKISVGADRSPIALEFSRLPKGAVFHLWEPGAYERYGKMKIFLHGLAIGLLAVTTALLLALFVITQAGYCANTGIFSALGVLYLLFGFGYLPHYLVVGDGINLFLFGAIQLLLAASAVGLVLSMVTFDPVDSWVKRGLTILLLCLVPIGLYVLFAAPFHLALLRLVVAAAALFVIYAVIRQRRKGIPGVRHSVIGWVLMFSAIAGGAVYLLSPYGSYFYVELFLYAALVLGLIWIGFSIFSQVSAGPFHGFAFRVPEKLSAPAALEGPEAETDPGVDQGPQENRYEVALAASKQGLWDWTTIGDQLHLSPYTYEMLGIEKIGSLRSEQDWKDRIHPDERQAYQDALTSYMRLGAVKFAMEWRVLHEEGDYRPILMKAECIPNERGKPSRIIGTLTDLSEDVDAAEKEEPEVDMAFPKPVGVAADRQEDTPPAKLNGGPSAHSEEEDDIIDELPLAAARSEAEQTTGDEASTAGVEAGPEPGQDTQPKSVRPVKIQLRGEEPTKGEETKIEARRETDPAPVELPQPSENDAIKETVGALYSDTAIAPDQDQSDAPEFDAEFPGYIGRAAFEADVDAALENLDREELARTNLRPAMLAVSIERSRTLSTASGEVAEADLMASFAERLRSIADPDDVLGQLSQDRFAIFTTVPEDITSADLARQASEILQHPLELKDLEAEPEVAVGASLWTGEGHRAEELILDAEEYLPVSAAAVAPEPAQTTAPAQADEAPEVSEEASNLERDLKAALQRFEMEVFYQPIMNLKHGRIAGFEALLRWNHPEKGRLEPKEFLPLAEKAGFLVRLNRFTLSMASLQLSQWQQFFKLEDPLFANVNISSRQLAGDGLISDVKEIMKSVKLAGGTLRLELPETILIDNEAEAQRILSELKSEGVSLVIDDFGTGHSNYERLKKYPFDVVKVDQSIVQSVETDPKAEGQIRELIKYAQEKRLEVVAEGVENEAIGRKLHELGCSHAQGFIFGWPMQAMEAQAFIANYWAK